MAASDDEERMAWFAMNARRRLVVRSANSDLRLGLLLAAACLGLSAATAKANPCANDDLSCAAPPAANFGAVEDGARGALIKRSVHQRPTAALAHGIAPEVGHAIIHKEPPKPRLLVPILNPSESTQTSRRPTDAVSSAEPQSNEAADCDVDGFATKTGNALAEHILSMTYKCVNNLFRDAPKPIRSAAFRTQNMLDMAQATVELMKTYEGTNPNHLFSKHYLFLRIAYYNHENHPDGLEWADGTSKTAVDNAVIAALDKFVQNDHFYDLTNAHGETAWEVFVLMGGRDFRQNSIAYLPKFIGWLERFGPQHVDKYDVRLSTSAIQSTLFNLHWEPSLISAVSSGIELIATLRDFALKDYMLDTDAQYLIDNAGNNLAQFIRYDTAPIYPEIVSGIQAIFNRYDSYGEGSTVWLATASVISYFDKCAEFQICGFERELEKRVLSVSHSCAEVGVDIRAEDLTSAQLARACESMAEVGSRFHQLLNTGRQPVADDYNTNLEVIVFANSDSYVAHSNLFFGNDTDNGGIYYEGNPAEVDNVARFFAYVADWLPDKPVWNLEHEYVHYLDGRFNIHGGFSLDYKVLWWAEGLAEYVSKGNDNERAVNLAPTQAYLLDDLYSTTYDHGETRVYRWGYLAVRFMFERHVYDVSELASHLRAGCFDGYQSYMERTIGTRYNDEWLEWLKAVKATDDFMANRGVESTPVACGPNFASGLDRPIPSVELFPIGETTSMDIAPFFEGFSTASLTFSVSSSNPEVAVASLAGSLLTLTALSSGEIVISITANDGGKSITRTFRLAVTEECPPWLCRSWASSWRWQLLMDSGSVH